VVKRIQKCGKNGILGLDRADFFIKPWLELKGMCFENVLISFLEAIPCRVRVAAQSSKVVLNPDGKTSQGCSNTCPPTRTARLPITSDRPSCTPDKEIFEYIRVYSRYLKKYSKNIYSMSNLYRT
jgi:hypothetical protein